MKAMIVAISASVVLSVSLCSAQGEEHGRTVKSSKSNSSERGQAAMTPAPASNDERATNLNSSKSNVTERSVKSSKSNSQDRVRSGKSNSDE